ncbi:MAG: TIGR04076 family protein, partial [Synergistaceae bacterium]|nr:TIGR04076 family protein [Synergistaceae bacterium]
FRIERIDYKALYIDGIKSDSDREKIVEALRKIPGVSGVNVRENFTETILEDKSVTDEALTEAIKCAGDFTVSKID